MSHVVVLGGTPLDNAQLFDQVISTGVFVIHSQASRIIATWRRHWKLEIQAFCAPAVSFAVLLFDLGWAKENQRSLWPFDRKQRHQTEWAIALRESSRALDTPARYGGRRIHGGSAGIGKARSETCRSANLRAPCADGWLVWLLRSRSAASASVGQVIYPLDGTTIEELLVRRTADSIRRRDAVERK